MAITDTARAVGAIQRGCLRAGDVVAPSVSETGAGSVVEDCCTRIEVTNL
jgi:hypothetical protein